jgi:hypothetical protein
LIDKKKRKQQKLCTIFTECAGGETSEHFHAGLAVDHAVRDGCVFSPEVFFRSRRRVISFCNIVHVSLFFGLFSTRDQARDNEF